MGNVSIKKQGFIKTAIILFCMIIMVAMISPQTYKRVTGFDLPQWLNYPFRLGLDLQGGTQLVYEANMNDIEESRRAEAIEGVRDVIERRVNSFGITEPLIQVSRSEDSWRLIVELAGVHNVNEAINLIGQTPLLEFKEFNTEPQRALTNDERAKLDEMNAASRKRADDFLDRIKKNSEEFETIKKEFDITQNVIIDAEGKAQVNMANILDKGVLTENITLTPDGSYAELYKEVGKTIKGGVVDHVIATEKALSLVKIDNINDEKEVEARHILICYDGATRCLNPRPKEEALAFIKSLKSKSTIKNFEQLAKENSTEPGASDGGGYLGRFGKGRMVKSFEEAVFALQKGSISDVVETEFGFHLIHKIEEYPFKTYEATRIFVPIKTANDVLPASARWKNTELSGKHLSRAVIDFDSRTNFPLINLEFNDEGKATFASVTERNLNKRMAIFLDGKSIIDTNGDGVVTETDEYAPTITAVIKEGRAQISQSDGGMSLDIAKKLSKRLNSGALPVAITLINQQTVGATLGSESIKASLNAGIYGVVLIAVFMIVYYQLLGIMAVASLAFYTGVMLLSFKLFGFTLTLSGIAGFILSIGMAVDANVLIFERIREELRLGKTLYASIGDGFKRAWLSIRDGNLSTLITCFVLLIFGAGLIKGFAITLGFGILVSMFSAITVTRIFIITCAPRSITKGNSWLFGIRNRS